MDFELSEEQTMLKDSVDRFVKENYEPNDRRALVDSALGFSRDHWQQFADMGWLALPFSEESGGLGGKAIDTNVLMEGLGAGLVLEPYLSTVLLGGRLIEEAGSTAQKEAVLPAVIEGQCLLAFAYAEPQSRYNLSNVTCQAEKTADGYQLNGTKSVVLHAASADKIVVSCRTSGNASDQDGISLFLLDRETPGLVTKDFRTVDGQRASDLAFDNVQVPSDALLGEEGNAYPVIEKVIDLAICALSAEAIGAMQTVNDMTKDYVGTRKQFGAPIGSNQVVKHRVVDMYVAAEEAKALCDISAMRADGSAEERLLAASAIKSKIGEAARFVGGQGVQLHGGIGMTDEFPIGHFYKRLMAIDMIFGNSDFHLNRYANAS
ncbi:acyl-CoA dehydrogenase family protein [Rhodovibrionaceae bacterium A322]